MNSGLGRGFLEGIKIDDDHVDGRNPVFGNGRAVPSIVPPMQNAAMHLGMQGLDAPIQHLREAGKFRNVFHRNAGIPQQLRCPAGRNQFHAKRSQPAREIDQS